MFFKKYFFCGKDITAEKQNFLINMVKPQVCINGNHGVTINDLKNILWL